MNDTTDPDTADSTAPDTGSDLDAATGNEHRGEVSDGSEPPGKLLRILLILVFAFIYQICEVVWFAVSVFQAIALVITDHRNERLDAFSVTLTGYMYSVLQYVCQHTDVRPWPLDDDAKPLDLA